MNSLRNTAQKQMKTVWYLFEKTVRKNGTKKLVNY